jgi:hypothetical protein
VEGEEPVREVNVDFDIPPQVKRGVYANSFNVWFSPYEFALDWAVADEVKAEDPDDPASRCGSRSWVSRAFASRQVSCLTCCGGSTKL